MLFLVVKELIDCGDGASFDFLFAQSVLQIEKAETWIAELFVVLPDKLSFNEAAPVGKLGGISFTLGFDNDNLVDFFVGGATDKQEVRYILPDVSPFLACLLVAVDLKFSQCVITIEVHFQILVSDYRKNGL